MEYSVDIDEIHTAFKNAHKHVSDARYFRNRVEGRRVWKEYFGITIGYTPIDEDERKNNDGLWHTLTFPSKEAYVLFMLEWS